LLNWIWLGLVLTSVVFAAFTGRMKAVSNASLDEAKHAIELVIGLTGAMVFFLGLVRVASDGGLLRFIIRGLRPILRRLFPSVPPDHPAMTAMVMNFAANILGLGNAATPFGLKAMVELDKLNQHKGVATDAMALFLAINATSITLMPPLGTVAVRVATGSQSPFSIWAPTLFATTCSTAVAIVCCLILQRLPLFAARPLRSRGEEDIPAPDLSNLPDLEIPEESAQPRSAGPWQWVLLLSFTAAVSVGYGLHVDNLFRSVGVIGVLQDAADAWLLPLLISGFLLIGVASRVPVYDALVEGGKEGLSVAVRIAPFLVAILVAIAMFRESGAMEALIGAVEPLTSLIGFPGEALPMAIMRPLSGSGAFGVMTSILETHGPDSFVGLVSSTLQGSTETTFYVLAIYLGAVRVRDSRHILPACLTGDFAGFLGALVACRFFFG
jgi:spore maturation protein SpmA